MPPVGDAPATDGRYRAGTSSLIISLAPVGEVVPALLPRSSEVAGLVGWQTGFVQARPGMVEQLPTALLWQFS